MKKNKNNIFELPPKGIFNKTNDSDPLDFYYMPLVGVLYRQRIQNGLRSTRMKQGFTGLITVKI